MYKILHLPSATEVYYDSSITDLDLLKGYGLYLEDERGFAEKYSSEKENIIIFLHCSKEHLNSVLDAVVKYASDDNELQDYWEHTKFKPVRREHFEVIEVPDV